MKQRANDRDRRRYLRFRLRVVGFAFLAAFLVLVGRAVDLQVFQHQDLESIARRGFIKRHKIPPRRGIIYDRNQVELAVSLDTDSVYARPAVVSNPRNTSIKLAKALGLPRRDLQKKLKGRRSFTWLARRIPPQKAQAVRHLDIKGVGLQSEPRRFYPFNNLACHLLGFAGLDAKGLAGLELRYDPVLRGRLRTVTSMRDALGRTIHLSQQEFSSLPEGHHIILTIDKNLQYRTEKILSDTVRKYRAKSGQAVVMVPSTGEILAMASAPNFNPNVYGRYSRQSYRNRVVTDAFEPGSTFKIFVAAAALRSKSINLEQLFDCENGQWRIGRRIIHDTHPYDKLNLADIIKFSSNIGAAKIGQELGAQELYQTLKAFGFGRQSGVNLPGESSGILRPASSWRPVELANICFGQGVAVTPIQLVSAISAVANGGMMMRPFVVRAQVDQDANLISETRPRTMGRALSARSARILTNMMARVTEPGGTGTRARVEPFAVAGKTGTAQKVLPGGGYSHKDYMSSFVGFVPADDPKVAVLVLIDTPKGQHYGGVVAGPAFAAIARAALTSMGIVSSQPVKLLEAKKQPVEQEALAAGETRTTPTDAAKEIAAGLTPDLRGLTLRQVLGLNGHKGVKVLAQGWGRVISQNPKPGAPLSPSLSVSLAPAGGGA